MAGLTTLTRRIESLEDSLSDVRATLKNAPQVEKAVAPLLKELEESFAAKIKGIKFPTPKDYEEDIRELEEDLVRLRSAISYQTGGGQANRNIAIGGNTSILGYYTDINLKPGSNVTFTVSPNTTTRYTDITIAATGGPGGTTRVVSSIATSQTAGATAGTDYVYIASAGIALTLPTATANSNLYTIKNTGASSVLVAPDGSDTIDTQSNLILVTQYTSVDLVSDGVDNWNIT